mgnify:FL=1|tara:strand:- start:32 stop:700 length:669 start_codon:yes stop_codon:yes gene_type:complete
MSHFSQTALPPQDTHRNSTTTKMNLRKSPPTQRGMDMSNAFIQIFNYNLGDAKHAVYNSDEQLYYALFSMDYTEYIPDLEKFIIDNKHLLINYLSDHYSDEYKQTDYYKDKEHHWEQCNASEIIYALSSENPLCLQMLSYMKSNSTHHAYDMIKWENNSIKFRYTDDAAASSDSGEPCEPTESSEENKQFLHYHTIKKPTLSKKELDHISYNFDGVIGGVDH